MGRGAGARLCRAGGLRLSVRRGTDATQRYPELAGLGEALAGRARSSTARWSRSTRRAGRASACCNGAWGSPTPARIRRRAAEARVTYVAFDLLWLDGRSLLAEPYERRREQLAGLELDAPWQTPRHHLGDGEALLGAVRERGLEGIVAKRLGSPYRPGRRTPDWVKVQNRRRQELVIGGWLPGEGARRRGPGRCWSATGTRLPWRPSGSGARSVSSTRAASAPASPTRPRRARRRLAPLERESSPFEPGEDPEVKYAARARERGGPVWSRPELVCEVEFTSGRTRTPCARRRSRDCATTRTRARWCASRDARSRSHGRARQDSAGNLEY